MATILIVDDEPVILDVFRRFLEADDRTLVLAGSAREAIARAQEPGELDVALVDKNLGDGSGLDVARALRRAKPDVEVILVTGYASLDSAIQAMQIGAFDYVTKPISDYEALNLKVENAAEKVRMKRRQRELVGQLVESEALHRGVFETSSDAVLLVDAETGRIEDANPAAERLYGSSRDALRKLGLGDLCDPEADRSVPAGGTRALPGRHRRGDGTPFPVEVSVGELFLRERALRVLSIRDVSERESAETARRELEQSLRQAQKMEAVGRLAGGIAHDFSNLLAVILGWSDMLVRDLPASDARLRESADGIIEAAHRAVGVTRQLLTLSRKKLLRPEVLSLNKVVQDLGRLLSRAIGERIELSTALEDGLWSVVADSDQLAQVLLNLAVNARDAMPDGGPLAIATANVELGCAATDVGLPAGRYVTLVGEGRRHRDDRGRCAPGCSSRSSRRRTRAPASGSRRCTGSSGRRGGGDPRRVAPRRAGRRSPCSCRRPTSGRRASCSRSRRRRRAGSARRSCSPRTRTRSGCCSGACSPARATTSSRAATARRRSRRSARAAGGSTCSSPTS